MNTDTKSNFNINTLISNLADGLLLIDHEGRITFCNPEALNILGFSESQVIGKTLLEFDFHLIKEDGTPIKREDFPVAKVVKTGVPLKQLSIGLQAPHIKTRWLIVSAIPIKDDTAPHLRNTLVTLSNVTKEISQAKMLKGIIENTPGIIYQFILNTEGRQYFSFISPKTYEHFEITSKEFELDPSLLIKMVHPEDQADLAAKIAESAQTLQPFAWEGRTVTKSGKIRWSTARSIPQKDMDGNIIWDGLVTDVTKETELKMELEAQRLRSVKTSRLVSLGELSAGVAHEINNPLAIISNAIILVTKFINSPEKLAAPVEAIQKSCARISKIVTGLRKYSRSAESRVFERHSLKEISKEAVVLIETKSKREDVTISTDFKTDGWINCDEIEIEQVLINLLNNAIDAAKSDSEKWVRLAVFENESSVILQIVNSGPAMPEEVRTKLFQPFFTTKKVGEGTGLGLSIVKGIVDEHKAEIDLIKNLPNTCFEVRFPKMDTAKNGT